MLEVAPQLTRFMLLSKRALVSRGSNTKTSFNALQLEIKDKSSLAGWCSQKAQIGWSSRGLADFKTLFPLSAAQVAPKNVFLYVPEVKRWLDSIGPMRMRIFLIKKLQTQKQLSQSPTYKAEMAQIFDLTKFCW